MKDIDDLKKEIAETTDRELDPRRKEKALRDKVRQLDQEYDYHLARINKGKNWLHDNYPDFFHRDPWTPKRWLKKGKLGKILGRTRFEEVYAELARQSLPFNAPNRERTRKLGGYAWEGRVPERREVKLPDGTVQPPEKKRMHLIVIPDVPAIVEELHMSKKGVHLYLSEMIRCGVLQELPKKLDRGQRAFVMGEWGYYRDARTGTFELRRYWLLKSTDKKMRAKLLTFKVRADESRV
jgi:hypothetical protein